MVSKFIIKCASCGSCNIDYKATKGYIYGYTQIIRTELICKDCGEKEEIINEQSITRRY